MAAHGDRWFSGEETDILVEIVHDYLGHVHGKAKPGHASPKVMRELLLDLCKCHGMSEQKADLFAIKFDLEPSAPVGTGKAWSS